VNSLSDAMRIRAIFFRLISSARGPKKQFAFRPLRHCRALNRHRAWAAIRKRARNAGFFGTVGCHTWPATGVTVYLENGGLLKHAQQIAAHQSPRATMLYDRTKDEIPIAAVERIQL
jgi:hypothetical protein